MLEYLYRAVPFQHAGGHGHGIQTHKSKLYVNTESSGHLLTATLLFIANPLIAMSASEVSPEFLLDLVIGIITVACNILMLLQAERIFQRTRYTADPN